MWKLKARWFSELSKVMNKGGAGSGDSRLSLLTLGCYIRCTRPFLLGREVLPGWFGSVSQNDVGSPGHLRHLSGISLEENPTLLPTRGALSHCARLALFL